VSAAVDLLTELVRADTVGAREGASARRCADLLADAGFTVAVPGWEPGREQLVARTGSVSGIGAPLTLTGHLDTVPTGDPAAWAADPWGAERDGQRVLGRGTSDMKSGVAALLVAAAQHARRPHDCRGVQVVLTAGEETGCTGALALRAADLATGGPLLVAEPTANRLVPGHKGVHWLELTATGRAAHGSTPELGDNAVVRLARAAVALHDHTGWPRHDTFGAVTTVPGFDTDAHRASVAALAGDGVAVGDHLVLPVVDTATDDPFCLLVKDALRAGGLDPEPAPPARFFTDASVLGPLLGTGGAPCPTVVLGPGEPDQCHVRDEWCSASRVDTAVEVYAVLLDRWCTR